MILWPDLVVLSSTSVTSILTAHVQWQHIQTTDVYFTLRGTISYHVHDKSL